VWREGPVIKPTVQPGLWLGDSGDNRIPTNLTAGITPILEDSKHRYRVPASSSTNGNEQLLGVSSFLPANSEVVAVYAKARTGTPTVTLGTASGGNQMATSTVLSTSWKKLPLGTGTLVTAADDLWAGSNSSDIVDWDIVVEPIR
jgi:hypothetical protein